MRLNRNHIIAWDKDRRWVDPVATDVQTNGPLGEARDELLQSICSAENNPITLEE